MCAEQLYKCSFVIAVPTTKDPSPERQAGREEERRVMADGQGKRDTQFKWSRNLREESLTEINRLKLIEKQKQLLQSKRARQPQVTATLSSETSVSRLYKGSSLTGANVSSNERLIDGVSEKETSSGIVNEALVPDNDSTTHTSSSSSTATVAKLSANRVPKSNSVVESSDSDSLDSLLENVYTDDTEDPSECTPGGNNGKLDKLSDSTPDDQIKFNQATANFNPLATIPSKKELLTFASSPLPVNKLYQCTIRRDKRGLDQSFYPTYFMYLQSIVDRCNSPRSDAPHSRVNHDPMDDVKSKILDNFTVTDNNRQVFLMCGRRRKKSRYYSISLDPFDMSKSNSIGKLKYNIIGTQFTFYRRLGPRQSVADATITYDANILGFKGPRKMTVSFADPPSKDPTRRANKGNIQLKNKIPVWNEESQSYVLNFHGRVTQASVKNFQLVQCTNDDSPSPCESMQAKDQVQMWFNQQQSHDTTVNESLDSTDDDTLRYAPTQPVSSPSHSLPLDIQVVMQFGRVSDKEFTCDIRYPLSPFQAFAIALSSFDSKLACE